jgi:N-methylhydantoinase B
VREYEVLEDGVELFGYSDRHRFSPRGTAGGGAGSTGAFSVLRAGEEIKLPSKARYALLKGDLVRIVVGGGGGFGNPSERPVESILEDLREGKQSPAAAQRLYPQVKPHLAGQQT